MESPKPVDQSELDKRWRRVDSLEQQGLIASALQEVLKIKQSAIAGQLSGHLIKAVVYENKYQNQLEEDSSIKALSRGEEALASYPEPAKSVMHSLLAQWYTNYLQAHLWQLRSTSDYTGPAGPDIRTWGIPHFINRIYEHYTASIQWDGLKSSKVADYLILLTESRNTDELRPTLYDILMHRALDFASGSEAYMTRPTFAYTLTDPSAFNPAPEFVSKLFATSDSLDQTWKALTWFQQLLSYRLSDQNHPAALLDADLKRLQFVYDHIVTDNKDSLYQHALEKLADQNQKIPESSLVNYYIAQLWVQQGASWKDGAGNPFKDRFKKALDLCQQSIKAFPDAYGSQLCKTLLQQIEQKSLSAAAESVNLPGEELLAKLDYRNVNTVFIRLVKLPESPRRWKNDTWEGEKILSRLNQLSPLKAWKQDLKGTEDYQPHATEIGLPALEVGHYAMVISDQEDFNIKSSTTGTLLFTVSNLSYWLLDDRMADQKLAVVNRQTGVAEPGVKAEFISMDYSPSLRRQVENKIGEGTSDANGWIDVPANYTSTYNNNLSIRLTKGKDELFTDDTYYTYRYGGNDHNRASTLFFSDRAIYRPGQKFYFKGYAVNFNSKDLPSIAANEDVEVILYDANNQEVAKKNFTTNAYGTFAGQFDLPRGGLTGQMSISSSFGASRYYFHVEEYKRPKFEVTFDTLKETVRLNESVTIRGRAKDFAGSPVGGAKVGFIVERSTYLPWWYGYYRKFVPYSDDRQVLKTGQALTNEDGSVDITFEAKSKPGSDDDLMYRFEITLFVTDITGESHESTKTLVLNKQGYEVNIDLPQEASIAQLKTINLHATNSDGTDVTVSGNVEISPIVGPDRNKRNRLWKAPDILMLTESDYQVRFANYFIPGKEDRPNWPVQNSLGSKSIEIKGTGKADLIGLIMKPGYYRLTWKWMDAAHKELTLTQYIMVYAPGQSLPGYAVMQVNADNRAYEPGEEVKMDVLSGLPNAPGAIRIVEHRTSPSSRSWLQVPATGNSVASLTEDDRGGMAVTYLMVYNNRHLQSLQSIQVPWSNKDLKVELKTWRDKMEPGDEETWTITVGGQKGEQVTAEMLMSMYDASLDAFVPHQWAMSLYPSFYSKYIIQDANAKAVSYWGLTYHWNQNNVDVPYLQYRDLNTYGYYPEGYYYPRRSGPETYEDGVMMKAQAPAAAKPGMEDRKSSDLSLNEPPSPPAQKTEVEASPPLRSALDETVFFFPQVMTDATGKLTFNFKMKEGLTRWKFQALAYTKDLAFGLTTEEVVTQKQLMVFPNPPRFFRAGDTIDFQIKVTNLTTSDLSGESKLSILDAFTNEDVSSTWKLINTIHPVSIAAARSTAVSWTVQVPMDWIRPVKYQVYAKAGQFTDGEESLLPVVTNRILITETLPLPIKSNETRTFIFKSMLDHPSTTLVNHQYVVEMTTSPAWYAVQALPYLMEYPHECAEQTFSRLYANTLASFIANKYPAIQQVYDAWRQSGDDALLSNLQKNQDLKSAMLDETPWVRDAMGETNQKKDIALLFEPNRLRMETRQALDRLRQLQMSNGGFPWFPGGPDNWYITQYIMEGFGHLKKMGVPLQGNNGNDIVQQGIPYCDARMMEWYDELKRLAAAGKIKMEDHQIGAMQVHYLYTRSFYPDIEHQAKLDEVINYVKGQVDKYWLQHGLYDQGLMALGVYRMWPNAPVSKSILASLREKTIVNDELGRYWKMTDGFYWNESPVEMQSLMIELYQDMKVPQDETDQLRVWLLKQKQTTRWKSTKATSEAIYALLIHPDTWLSSTGIVEVKLGSQVVIGKGTDTQAGTGYAKKSWTGKEIQKDWSTITVSNPNNHIAWGSAYWQYWEDLDKVKSPVDNNPLKVTRTMLIEKKGDRGAQTVPANPEQLKVGDKLIVRLTVETDRAMEFVHLKDVRASGFEPMDVISGYRWGGGLGYYQSTKDLATHFFIDYLPRGKYLIEYTVSVAQAGHYSEGLATLQCMYAPEFSNHSAGSRVSASRE